MSKTLLCVIMAVLTGGGMVVWIVLLIRDGIRWTRLRRDEEKKRIE